MDSAGEARASLWDRLRNARIPQLLGVYAAGSFAVIEGGDILIERLLLPEGTFVVLLLAIAAGLPLLVITALVQQGRRAEEGRAAEAELLARAGSGPASPDGSPEPGTEAAAGGSALGRIFTWRNAGLGAAAVAGLLVLLSAGYLGARALGIGPVGSLVAAGVLEREEPILISDFQSRTGDDVLAGAVTEAFRIDLEQSPLVRVVGPGTVRDALGRMQLPSDAPLTPELARELAIREGIRAVLLGEINPAGRGVMLSVRLISSESEETLLSFRESVSDSASIIPSVDRLSNRVRGQIGESLASIGRGESLERVSTGSLPALRLYSQGIRAIEFERDIPAGIALLQEAIALDSTFAMAWRKLGVTYANQGYPGELSDEAFTRAWELRDRLTERERYLTQAIYHSHVLGDRDRAVVAYRSLLDRYPAETAALNNLAVMLTDRGEFAEAAELYGRALQVDSTRIIYYTNLLGSLTVQERWDEAERLLERFAARFSELGTVDIARARYEAVRGRYDDAARRLRRVLDDPASTVVDQAEAAEALSSLAQLRGRIEESRRFLSEAWRIRERMGQTVSVGERMSFDVRAELLLRQDTAAAVRGARSLVAAAGLPPEAAREGTHLEAATFFASLGLTDRAREFLEQWDSAPMDERARARFARDREHVELRVAEREGRPEELLRFLRRQEREGGCPRCLALEIAEVHDRAGRPDSALVHYERYVQGKWLSSLGLDAARLHAVHERLAELYRARGEAEAERRHLEAFVALWEDADPDLQPRVRAARDRLASLGGSAPDADGRTTSPAAPPAPRDPR